MLTLTIGRNVGRIPLSDEHWAAFIHNARQLFTRPNKGAPIVKRGRGIWEGEAEDNARITFERINRAPGGGDLLQLAALARAFGQDAIAVTWTTGNQPGARKSALLVYADGRLTSADPAR